MKKKKLKQTNATNIYYIMGHGTLSNTPMILQNDLKQNLEDLLPLISPITHPRTAPPHHYIAKLRERTR